MPWRVECRRCLVEVNGVAVIEVDEVYQDDVADGDDAFPIDGDQIDLVPAVRESVLLELPDDVLCRDDCAGICPVLWHRPQPGVVRCDTSVRDDSVGRTRPLRLDDD